MTPTNPPSSNDDISTPRTDAIEYIPYMGTKGDGDLVPRSHARQLERELIRLSAEREKEREEIKTVLGLTDLPYEPTLAVAIEARLKLERGQRDKWYSSSEVFKEGLRCANLEAESLRTTLAERDRQLTEWEVARDKEWRETCIHHTDQERASAGCPVCVGKRLAERDRQLEEARIWFDLGRLTVAIAHGKALVGSAKELDDNPVNCISVIVNRLATSERQRKELEGRAVALCEDLIGMVEEYHSCEWGDNEPFTPDFVELDKRLQSLRSTETPTDTPSSNH